MLSFKVDQPCCCVLLICCSRFAGISAVNINSISRNIICFTPVRMSAETLSTAQIIRNIFKESFKFRSNHEASLRRMRRWRKSTRTRRRRRRMATCRAAGLSMITSAAILSDLHIDINITFLSNCTFFQTALSLSNYPFLLN